jgi:hypothetical protein
MNLEILTMNLEILTRKPQRCRKEQLALCANSLDESMELEAEAEVDVIFQDAFSQTDPLFGG